MTSIDWPELMKHGIGGLRMKPEAFWSLTPAELMMLSGRANSGRPIDRNEFDALIRSFPDNDGVNP